MVNLATGTASSCRLEPQLAAGSRVFPSFRVGLVWFQLGSGPPVHIRPLSEPMGAAARPFFDPRNGLSSGRVRSNSTQKFRKCSGVDRMPGTKLKPCQASPKHPKTHEPAATFGSSRLL